MIFFYAFVFIIILNRVYKKKGITSSTFLIFLYTMQALAAVCLWLFFDKGSNPSIHDYNFGILYLLVALLIFLYPFIDIRDDKLKNITIPNDGVMKIMKYSMVVLSIYSLIYFTPIMVAMLFVNIEDVAELRYAVSQGKHPFIEETIFNTIAGTAASFYVLPMILFFVETVKKKKVTLFSFLLLVSSLSYPVFVLAYLCRDGVLFWGFTFVALFLLFKNMLDYQVKKQIRKLLKYIIGVFAVVFLFITIGRFAYSSTVGDSEGTSTMVESLFKYLGSSPINFAEVYYTDVKNLNYGSSMFPLLFGEVESKLGGIEKYGLVTWVFKTFVYSIYDDFGSILTIVIGLLLLFAYRVLYPKQRRSGVYSFSLLLTYMFVFNIYSQGVFYFRQYNRVGNLFIISMILLSFIMNYFPQQVLIKDGKNKLRDNARS